MPVVLCFMFTFAVLIDASVQFVSSSFTGSENDSLFMDICVQAVLPGNGSGIGSFESDLIVNITSMMETAGLLE